METDEERALVRRAAAIEKLENPVSFVAGGALALLYFVWRWNHGVIATYTWMIPFALGLAVVRFGFAIVGSRADQALRGYREGGQLPEARVVAQLPAPRAPPRPALPQVALVAPEPAPEPPRPGEPPRLLK